MLAAAFITTQLQQLSLVCEKQSQSLKAFPRIKEASNRDLFHGRAAQVEILKGGMGVFANLSSITAVHYHRRFFLLVQII